MGLVGPGVDAVAEVWDVDCRPRRHSPVPRELLVKEPLDSSSSAVSELVAVLVHRLPE